MGVSLVSPHGMRMWQFCALGDWAIETEESKIGLTLTEMHTGEDLIDGLVQSKFYGEMILDSGHLGPRSLLSSKQAA